MDRFTLEIDLRGEAMQQAGIMELAAAVREVAVKIECGMTESMVIDLNGNTIGKWEVR